MSWGATPSLDPSGLPLLLLLLLALLCVCCCLLAALGLHLVLGRGGWRQGPRGRRGSRVAADDRLEEHELGGNGWDAGSEDDPDAETLLGEPGGEVELWGGRVGERRGATTYMLGDQDMADAEGEDWGSKKKGWSSAAVLD